MNPVDWSVFTARNHTGMTSLNNFNFGPLLPVHDTLIFLSFPFRDVFHISSHY